MTDPKKTNDPLTKDDSFESDWASAMAEQQAGEQQAASISDAATQADGLSSALDDDWAAALAEQTATTLNNSEPSHSSSAQTASESVFQPFEKTENNSPTDIDMIMDIPVQLSVELGRTRLTLKNILQLGQGSVVELDGLAGEPMDIFVNGYLIAQGEVVVVDEKYGIRITDIVTPSDRIQRLNSRR